LQGEALEQPADLSLVAPGGNDHAYRRVSAVLSGSRHSRVSGKERLLARGFQPAKTFTRGPEPLARFMAGLDPERFLVGRARLAEASDLVMRVPLDAGKQGGRVAKAARLGA